MGLTAFQRYTLATIAHLYAAEDDTALQADILRTAAGQLETEGIAVPPLDGMTAVLCGISAVLNEVLRDPTNNQLEQLRETIGKIMPGRHTP